MSASKVIGVVTSRFNSEVTSKLEEGAIKILEKAGVEIELVRVPGAFEIPLACQGLFLRGCQGIVALGAVIRGETSHYDFVCNAVERGISQVSLEWHRPISFGVLTTDNEEQAQERVGGKHGHKGEEAAQVCLEMVGLLSKLSIKDFAPGYESWAEGLKESAKKSKKIQISKKNQKKKRK